MFPDNEKSDLRVSYNHVCPQKLLENSSQYKMKGHQSLTTFPKIISIREIASPNNGAAKF